MQAYSLTHGSPKDGAAIRLRGRFLSAGENVSRARKQTADFISPDTVAGNVKANFVLTVENIQGSDLIMILL